MPWCKAMPATVLCLPDDVLQTIAERLNWRVMLLLSGLCVRLRRAVRDAARMRLQYNTDVVPLGMPLLRALRFSQRRPVILSVTDGKAYPTSYELRGSSGVVYFNQALRFEDSVFDVLCAEAMRWGGEDLWFCGMRGGRLAIVRHTPDAKWEVITSSRRSVWIIDILARGPLGGSTHRIGCYALSDDGVLYSATYNARASRLSMRRLRTGVVALSESLFMKRDGTMMRQDRLRIIPYMRMAWLGLAVYGDTNEEAWGHVSWSPNQFVRMSGAHVAADPTRACMELVRTWRDAWGVSAVGTHEGVSKG